MLILKLFLLSLVSMSTTDLRVLFFTMDSCPPCKQTEPGIDRLQREGIAVSKIDVRQHSQYASQCQVQRTPTIMVVEGSRVVARHTGAMNYGQLRQMLQNVTPAQAVSTSRSTGGQSPPANGVSRLSSLTPEERAYQATVRFRVEDGEGTSFATGTVVHRVGQEALVLTCGHVFRDSQGQGKINADLGFAIGQPITVTGKLMFYDANDHDIALVAIPCPLEIEPIPVAPEQLVVQTGDRIFSLGCDRGQPPTARRSVLKAVTRYSGIAKYDIVGRPVDGRSGGGLFSAGGQLIGVCNAAAVEVDEGIYTGLQSVYWQFAKTNLTHLFRRDAVPSRLSFNDPVQVASKNNSMMARPVPPDANRPLPSTRGLAHPSNRNSAPTSNVVARNDELAPPVATAIHRGGPVPVNNAVYRGQGVPVRSAADRNHETDSFEVIVLVRSRTDPAKNETITISNPNEETLSWIRREQARQGGASTSGSRVAQLPIVRAPGRQSGEVQMRAQSPR